MGTDGMVRLRVLGGFSLEGAAGIGVPPRPQRRGDAVLAVLAVCGDRGCTRDRIASLIWPESREARAQQGLRDALYAVRRALPGAVVADGRRLQLDPAVVTSDVRDFGEALAAGRLADAVEWYRGPLLDGFHVDGSAEFEQWLDGERARLARGYARALELLASAAERAEAWHEALAWWARAIELDPLNSRFAMRHARALATLGDPANALKAADTHAQRLRDDLDIEPDREFLAEIARIRQGAVPAWSAAADDAPGAAAPNEASRSGPASGPAVTGLTGAEAATPQHRRSGARALLRRLPWLGVFAAVVLIGTLAIRRWLPAQLTVRHPPRTAIAVLPCLYRSRDSSRAFVAAGLHDELLTRLYQVPSLTVVGRMTVAGYQRTTEPARRIAEELGVGTIAECSVEVQGDRLRVSVHLIDPFTQVTVWAERYDTRVDEVLAVESDIAQRIAAAVGATLTKPEAGAIATVSTPSVQAYAFYLQGLDYFRRPGLLGTNLETAGRLFEQALVLDSTFAPAMTALARVDFAMHHLGYDRTPARLARAVRESDAALRLAPDLPQAHLAAGLARIETHDDARGALREFETAVRGAPSDADMWLFLGIARGKLREWDGMLAAFDRARRLDPRNAVVYHALGDRLHYLHRYREAIDAYRREAALAPDVAQARLSMSWSYILWTGNLDTLRAVLRDLPTDRDVGMGGGSIAEDRALLAWMERRPDSLLALARRLKDNGSRLEFTARAELLRGDSAAARATYDTLAAQLRERERMHRDELETHIVLGRALAGAGHRDEALQEAHWIARTAAYQHDGDVAAMRAEILLGAGEVGPALKDLERALASPSTISVPMVRLFPEWDPIVADPRGRQLLAKYAEPGVR